MKNPYFNLIRTVWLYGKPWRRQILGYYLAFIVAQAFIGLNPYAFGRTVEVLQHFSPDQLFSVVFWLGVSVIVLLLFWLFHGPARVIERQVALKIQQAFRMNMYQQLTNLPLKWHQDHHSGNVITCINRASTALYRFAGEQFMYIELVVKFVISMAFLIWISLPVGLMSLLTCLIAAGAVKLFDRKLIPLYAQQNEIDNHVGGVLFDYVTNMTTILTLRLGELTQRNLSQRILSVWPYFRKEAILNEAKWFCMMMVLTAAQSVILVSYIIHHLNAHGAVMIGIVVMIFRYQWELSEVFYSLSANYSELVRMNTDIQGINSILADIERLAHATQELPLAREWHKLEIRNLIFNHATNERPGNNVIKGLNFSINRGEKVALIGSSGGGKSTLLNLLRGLYNPEQVQLVIDNISFDSLEPLACITTLIPQDPEIFENTIAFNITMDVDATPEEINNSVKLAGFGPVLASLPNGLATDIREKGLNLSVGQKQRLALARGLFAARFSSLILLDEPTSSVDLPTEKEILSGVIEAFPDAAIMVSLHRLHLLPKFDRIIMLQEGQAIASGAVSELLNNPGPVRDLWIAYQE